MRRLCAAWRLPSTCPCGGERFLRLSRDSGADQRSSQYGRNRRDKSNRRPSTPDFDRKPPSPAQRALPRDEPPGFRLKLLAIAAPPIRVASRISAQSVSRAPETRRTALLPKTYSVRSRYEALTLPPLASSLLPLWRPGGGLSGRCAWLSSSETCSTVLRSRARRHRGRDLRPGRRLPGVSVAAGELLLRRRRRGHDGASRAVPENTGI